MSNLDKLNLEQLREKALKLKLDNEKIKKKYGKTRSKLRKNQLIDLIRKKTQFKVDKKKFPERTACIRSFTKTKEGRKSTYTLVASKDNSATCVYKRSRYHTGSTKKK